MKMVPELCETSDEVVGCAECEALFRQQRKFEVLCKSCQKKREEDMYDPNQKTGD